MISLERHTPLPKKRSFSLFLRGRYYGNKPKVERDNYFSSYMCLWSSERGNFNY